MRRILILIVLLLVTGCSAGAPQNPTATPFDPALVSIIEAEAFCDSRGMLLPTGNQLRAAIEQGQLEVRINNWVLADEGDGYLIYDLEINDVRPPQPDLHTERAGVRCVLPVPPTPQGSGA
jgi:hypothetical protein